MRKKLKMSGRVLPDIFYYATLGLDFKENYFLERVQIIG